MTKLIASLQRPDPAHHFPSALAHARYIDGLRLQAAASLLDVAGSLQVIRRSIKGGVKLAHPCLIDILQDAQSTLQDGVSLSRALDMDLGSIPAGSLAARLTRMHADRSVENARLAQYLCDECRAAATHISLTQSRVQLLETHFPVMGKSLLMQTLRHLEDGCWSIPDHLRDVPQHDPIAA